MFLKASNTTNRYFMQFSCFQALKLCPGDCETAYNLGVAYDAKNDLDDAILMYRKALVLLSSSNPQLEQRINKSISYAILRKSSIKLE